MTIRQARKVFTRQCLMGYVPEIYEGRWRHRERTIDEAFSICFHRGGRRPRKTVRPAVPYDVDQEAPF